MYNECLKYISVSLALTLLSACGGGYPKFEGDSRYYDSDSPKIEKQKIGRPYQINGRWYRPHIDTSYDEVGIASWYGPGFHGKPTANGERFDENRISAAHTTLPLPSYVEVTNLSNGRQLYVRVNDRGPFADDRILDLSRRAAELLGMKKLGLARVRVRLTDPPQNITLLAPDGTRQIGRSHTPQGQKKIIVASADTSSDNDVVKNSDAQGENTIIDTPYIPLSQKNIIDQQPEQLAALENSDELLITSTIKSGIVKESQYMIRVGRYENADQIDQLLKQDLAKLGSLQIKTIQFEGKAYSEVFLKGYKNAEQVLETVDALAEIGISDATIINQNM